MSESKKSRRWATFQSAEYPIYCDGHGDCPSYLIYPSDPPGKVFAHWHAPLQAGEDIHRCRNCFALTGSGQTKVLSKEITPGE